MAKLIIEANVRGSDLYVFQAPVAPGDPRSLYDRTVMLMHAIEAVGAHLARDFAPGSDEKGAFRDRLIVLD